MKFPVCGKYDMGNDSFLQNGNQKRQPEAATRYGNQKRQKAKMKKFSTPELMGEHEGQVRAGPHAC
jgi:hypothetical protein